MGWTVIQNVAAPSSNVFDVSGLSLGSYQRVVLLLDGVTVGTDGAFLVLQLYTATTLRTASYRYKTQNLSSGNSSDDTASTSAASIRLAGGSSSAWGVGNASTKSYAGRIEVGNLVSGLHKLVIADGAHIASGGNVVRSIVAGILEQTGAVDGVKISTSTGTMPAGQLTIYGLTTS